MAALESKMVSLGTQIPHFELLTCNGKEKYSRNELLAKNGLVVMFVSHHCPFVKHLHSGITELWHDYQSKDVNFVGISSNDVESYPDDSPENLQALWNELGLDFPVLYDEDQTVAKNFEAVCTPDFFIYTNTGDLYYRGQFDDSRPGNDIIVTGRSIRSALDAIIANKKSPTDQLPSIGCSIKWK